MLSKKKNSKEEFWTSISEKLALKNWTESLKGIEKKDWSAKKKKLLGQEG